MIESKIINEEEFTWYCTAFFHTTNAIFHKITKRRDKYAQAYATLYVYCK